MSIFNRTTYVASAHDRKDLLPDVGWEIAFAGRSNSGKSSAINTITGRNRLAFASKTPGRTQLINFFALEAGRHLVDLPGYGYADVPEKERRRWGEFIAVYLAERVALRGLFVIMDARHPMTPLDEQLLEWFLPAGKPMHILLTKADKLSRRESADQLTSVRAALRSHGPQCSAQLFSSLKRTGVDEARAVLLRWFELERDKERPPVEGD
ncbi:MAG: ribosome biogenesis GTP-binding protein YihA/YsxC [Betaproteobacteria bacterium]